MRFLRRWYDDTGSLPVAMLLVMIGSSLSALLIPIMLTQLTATRQDVRRLDALNAAQAGIDVALGHIRAADDGSGNGVLASVPCGPFNGNVGGASAGRYQVTIAYYSQDPHGQSAAWLTANKLTCYGISGLYATPAFAVLNSIGTDQATGAFSSLPTRSLQAVYTFQTSNQNIAGGLIHVYKTATSTDLCFDAGSSSPAAGTNLQMQPCTANAIDQQFAYDANLNLYLVSTRTGGSLGMCLDAGTPHASGKVVKFQPCAATTSPQQQWSINDSANFEGTANGSTLDGYCFNVQSPNTAGSLVILSNVNCHQAYDNIETFSPEAAVGAGAAGADSGQLVNFSEFGRCLDVTEQNVAYPYLIAWPCKQSPDPAYLTWNQVWNTPHVPSGASSAGGPIYTTKAGVTYCLRSPGGTGPGLYVTVIPCVLGALPLNTTWTVYTDTGAYATSYVIKDGGNLCLQATDPTATPPDLYPKGKLISKIIVATCTGSTLQKWNAPPNVLQPLPLKDITEK
jgi:Ricin-type beta-trefoil lectin domain